METITTEPSNAMVAAIHSFQQGLHYSSMTKKKAGVVLILESMKDRKYWIRLKNTIEHFNQKNSSQLCCGVAVFVI